MFEWKRVLILAPHTDDAELGCGGTMARLLEEGVDLFVAVFSTADQSLPKGAPPGTLKEEFLMATKALGIPRENLEIFDFEVRKLNYHRQEILENIIGLKRKINPDAVFLPASTDLHQDHQVIHAEGLRAFKQTTVLGYELPWNHLSFGADLLVELEDPHLEKKWEALQSYQTQFILERPYFRRELIEGLARIRGVQAGVKYAEAYEVLRVVSRLPGKIE
ncbi:PIG-L deacetylase family protein [Thermus filiformis]|uniref:PIG-L deacetylase family protein n=1 Tax=Thermus filiformis TaxID=276 RepID=UPI00191C3F31|nr:PIG-L deacetylase family protein [Thermus filiformis]